MENLEQIFENVKKASRKLALIDIEIINRVLFELSELILKSKDFILQENSKDLASMSPEDPRYDRLKLNDSRLEGIAGDIRNVAGLEYPVGKILETKILPNLLELTKISVPLGVIGIIYESRPNVTSDVFSLCFKSGNACILKGGKEASFSNRAIISLINKVLEENNLDKNIVFLMKNDREDLKFFLNADKYIDVIIPRGGQDLINYVRKNATIPVIETGAGIVHTYFDKSGNPEIGKNIIFNAKTRRPSVCNALDTFLIHIDRIGDLPELVSLMNNKVEIFADEVSFNVLKGKYSGALLKQAKEEDFGKEFLSLRMSVKTVNNIDEAIEHITKYSSKHSEAIITDDEKAAEYFSNSIDAAAVYINTSTAFTDGAQFGMGAEIGISTQKLHARGPMALKELTSYKWIIRGSGQTRNN